MLHELADDAMETKFWHVFSPGPILDNLGKHLLVGDIINVSRTCRGLAGLYTELRSRQWDIDIPLKRFVHDPKAFRAQIGLTDAVLTGSFALEFFERGRWQTSKLDVVVGEGSAADQLKGYICNVENYKREDLNDEDSPYTFRHVIEVISFVRNTGRERIRMFVISSYSFPIRAIIEGIWTTSLVNFITYRMAYSMFPAPTFLRKETYLLELPAPDRNLPLREIFDLGWRLNASEPFRDATLKRTTMRPIRKVVDPYSWRLPLNMEGVKMPRINDPVDHEAVINVTEFATGIDDETQSRLETVAPFPKGNLKLYDLKYLRWSRIFI